MAIQRGTHLGPMRRISDYSFPQSSRHSIWAGVQSSAGGASMLSAHILEHSTERYLQNSIRAYFEKEPGCDLDWIVGVLGSRKITARALLGAKFAQYAFTEKYRVLMKRL